MNDALLDLMQESRCAPVTVVADVAAARRASAEFGYDFVLINSPLPDDPGLRFAVDLSSSEGTVVLFFARAEIYPETEEKLGRLGVFTISKPTSKTAMTAALSWMRSARERLRRSEKKTLTLEEKMEEIRLVNRAKWLLIGERGMDEAAAHRYIEKQAMDRCVTRREIARELLRGQEKGPDA
jgi:response regulator NasT